ncbi:MAG: cobalamin biosynthesis protein [Ectothiorhodospiraceae bacterium]|nr:cobalamin biosynthesis protein [Ectothiorhodospiraceae bacterium]
MALSPSFDSKTRLVVDLVLGMGCDRGVSLETLNTALDQALEKIGQNRGAVTALASIDKKNDEVALLALAEQNAWPLHFFSAGQLAQVEVPNPSAVVMKYMGTPAVAEAAAILAAEASMKDLLLEKHKYLGKDGKNATVSIVKRLNKK